MLKGAYSSRRATWPAAAFFVAITVILATRGPMKAAEDPSACPVEVPYQALWSSSGHADAEAEAFVHWDEDDPPAVPTRCAKCHSTPGYLDFLGADGTDAGTVDNPAPIGTTVTCVACHNEATTMMDSVTFPSGVEVTGLGDEARCMQCHQGRESGVSVTNAIADANLPDDDTASSSLRFINIHYYAAAATRWGGVAKGGYQYEGKSYDDRFTHIEGLDTCVSCHNSHSLQVKVEVCSSCHEEVVDHEDLTDIRLVGSTSDYDGDQDVSEGIYYEIEGLKEILYGAIRAYASARGAPIAYDSNAYPYFFSDTNGNGQVDGGEGGYNAFTPRSLRAAYNLHVSVKDPGGFAHGGKYIIQLLYDSIEDLDPSLVAGLRRIDAGHFAGSEEAWRHWDEDGHVPGGCSKCHSATGLPFFLAEGVTVSQPLSNGMLCTTCHDEIATFTRHTVDEVQFPSGAVLGFGEGASANLCISCHQGRESGASVDKAIGGLEPDTVATSLRFINVHYFAAGATLFGGEAKGAYQYAGKGYNGRFDHVGSFDTCTECHDTHNLRVSIHDCATCHRGIAGPQDIRRDSTDFDGDGNTQEGLAGEIATVRDALYAAMQDYAANVVGTPVAYADAYPYFFKDTNGNGQVDEGEVGSANQFRSWTPRLLQAAYNYQYSVKDTGAFAHNGKYILQVLYDSLESIGTKVPVDTAGMVRPHADAPPGACGDPGYPHPTGDLNKDCRVDWLDLATFGIHWMEDNNPL